MANCHELFQQYREELSIGQRKKERMIKSKNGLRDCIRVWFKKNHPEYEPVFFIQGSHKMRIAIRTKDDICDLDDGIYFMRESDVTATTLQGWIWEAVKGYTDTDPEHRKKCIRSTFAGDYEIDHPVYCQAEGQPYRIAVRDKGFEESDPKALIDWFNQNKDKDGKLCSIIMYLKGWCDNLRNKMPSGLSMTILAVNARNRIVLNDREDITLKDILKEIKKALNYRFECMVPAPPFDNIFGSYDDTRRNNFLQALDEFIADAEAALREDNQLKASKLWRKHLGKRFPEGKDENAQSSTWVSIASAKGATSSNPWANA